MGGDAARGYRAISADQMPMYSSAGLQAPRMPIVRAYEIPNAGVSG